RVLTQSRQDGEILIATFVDAWRLEREWNPDVARRLEELQRRVREAHALRHHAYDRARDGREHDGLAHDRGVGAEPPSPERVAEHHDLWRARAGIGISESAARRRRDPEQ